MTMDLAKQNSDLRIIIFGSCVTRDAFEFTNDKKIKLIEYFARSSLASAYSKQPVKNVSLELIHSPFQKRIVSADLDKSFPNVINEQEFDIIIYDPIDERFNILKLMSGELCTLSNELLQAEIHPLKENGQIINSGTDEFYKLWEQGWNSFVAQLITLNKLKNLKINKVYWATHSENGQDFLPTYSLAGINKANTFLKKLYQRMAEDLDPSQFLLADNTLIGADSHKWGRSPFHYTDGYYKQFINQLMET